MKRLLALTMGVMLVGVLAGPAQAATATITGSKFNDMNGNGVVNIGDVGIPGVTIYVDSNGNNSFDTGEPSTTTLANGTYGLTVNVPDGTNITVREVVPSGWQQTFPAGGEHSLIVSGDSTFTDINFGDQLIPVFGSITGTKFNDANGNGVMDAGEAGMAGITIFLDANGNGTLDSGEANTTTDSSGHFTFAGLASGSYTVREVGQAGWQQTFPGAAVNMQNMVTLNAGANITGVNFGNMAIPVGPGPARIGGINFWDVTGNGVMDGSDVGLAGWMMYLDTNNNNVRDPGEAAVLTDAGGNFSFPGLVDGTYTVREEIQSGWVQTAPSASLDGEIHVTIAGGQSVVDLAFGNWQGTTTGGVGGPGTTPTGTVAGEALPVTGSLPYALLPLLGLGIFLAGLRELQPEGSTRAHRRRR